MQQPGEIRLISKPHLISSQRSQMMRAAQGSLTRTASCGDCCAMIARLSLLVGVQ